MFAPYPAPIGIATGEKVLLYIPIEILVMEADGMYEMPGRVESTLLKEQLEIWTVF